MDFGSVQTKMLSNIYTTLQLSKYFYVSLIQCRCSYPNSYNYTVRYKLVRELSYLEKCLYERIVVLEAFQDPLFVCI